MSWLTWGVRTANPGLTSGWTSMVICPDDPSTPRHAFWLPKIPDRSQPISPMYSMVLTGLEVMAQLPVEQPTRA